MKVISVICSVISLHFESDSMSGNFQGPFSGEGFCTVRQFCKKTTHYSW